MQLLTAHIVFVFLHKSFPPSLLSLPLRSQQTEVALSCNPQLQSKYSSPRSLCFMRKYLLCLSSDLEAGCHWLCFNIVVFFHYYFCCLKASPAVSDAATWWWKRTMTTRSLSKGYRRQKTKPNQKTLDGELRV